MAVLKKLISLTRFNRNKTFSHAFYFFIVRNTCYILLFLNSDIQINK